MRKDIYDRVLDRIESAPNGPLASLYRRWVCKYHIQYGRMPPVIARMDWPDVPSWTKRG